jgi:hypothetical protein
MLCQRCGAQLSDPGKCCDNCGLAPARSFFQKKAVLVLTEIAGLGIALAFIRFFEWPGDTSTTKAPPAPKIEAARPEPAQCLDFVSPPQGEVNEYSTRISGVIKNNCGRDFRFVQVSFKLYDSSGSAVGIAFTNLAGLAGGDAWRFQAQGFTPSVRFRFDQITAH